MYTYVDPSIMAVREAVTRALEEDLNPLGDLTSALLDPELRTVARLVSREDGCLSGALAVDVTYQQIDPQIFVDWEVRDGATVAAGDLIATISGKMVPILLGERTALNFLGHLSGVATLTARYVQAAARQGGTAKVWDTRKTTPGLRSLEKAAVRAGGGRNHRGNLSDWILLKDNHIVGMSITEAVEKCRDLWPARTVHIECDHEEQMVEAIEAGANAVLLDNMSPAEVRACVATANTYRANGRDLLLEASGGVTIDTIGEYSACGVDQISTGKITNSASVLDIGLDITP